MHELKGGCTSGSMADPVCRGFVLPSSRADSKILRKGVQGWHLSLPENENPSERPIKSFTRRERKTHKHLHVEMHGLNFETTTPQVTTDSSKVASHLERISEASTSGILRASTFQSSLQASLESAGIMKVLRSPS